MDGAPGGWGRPTSSDEDYPASTKVGAALFTCVAPFLSLIAALMMMGNERNPVRRASLKLWAWVSGGLLALGVVILISVLASVAGSSGGSSSTKGPCTGGPKLGEPLTPLGHHRKTTDRSRQ